MESVIKNDRKNSFSISCKITNCESCPGSFLIPFFKYVEYKITLKTNKKNWEIKKRFKDFDQLHKKLSKSIKNLPKLPQKTIFKSDKILNDRKIQLQKYLTNLLRRHDVYNHDLIFDFIELKKEDYLLMNDNLDDENSSSERSPLYSPCRRSSIYAFKTVIELKNKEETIINDNFYYSFLNLDTEDSRKEAQRANTAKKLVNDFLNDLNSIKKNKNKSLIIDKFREEFLFNNYKRKNFAFKNEDIYKLFFGDKATKISGLLFHCGDIEKNSLGAESCVEFLSNLVDFEYNLESEFFINILRLGKLDVFKQMNLNFHLDSGKPNLFLSCCRLIRVILNEEKNITFDSLLSQDDLIIERVNNYFLRFDCVLFNVENTLL